MVRGRLVGVRVYICAVCAILCAQRTFVFFMLGGWKCCLLLLLSRLSGSKYHVYESMLFCSYSVVGNRIPVYIYFLLLRLPLFLLYFRCTHPSPPPRSTALTTICRPPCQIAHPRLIHCNRRNFLAFFIAIFSPRYVVTHDKKCPGEHRGRGLRRGDPDRSQLHRSLHDEGRARQRHRAGSRGREAWRRRQRWWQSEARRQVKRCPLETMYHPGGSALALCRRRAHTRKTSCPEWWGDGGGGRALEGGFTLVWFVLLARVWYGWFLMVYFVGFVDRASFFFFFLCPI